MIEKIRYTKKGKKIKIYEFNGKLHKNIIMNKEQFENHIIIKHPEITLNIIEDVLNNPDFVTKQSKSKKEHYYQKIIKNELYFIIVSEYKGIKNYRFILSAFKIDDEKFLQNKNKYYRYIK